MKKKLLLFVTLASILFTACNKEKDKELTQLSTESAKVEVRNASQQINGTMNAAMGLPAFSSLNFLFQLTGSGDYLKSSLKSVKPHFGTQWPQNLRKTLKNNPLKEVGFDELGIIKFNFDTGDFDLVESSTSLLKILYPADQTAYASGTNNAEFTAENLQFQTVTVMEEEWDWQTGQYILVQVEESVPTNAKITQKISNATVLTANYSAAYTSAGIPTSWNVNLNSAPYTFTSDLNGSGSNYSAAVMMKNGTAELMGADLDVQYTGNMEDVEKVSGYYLIAPLKIDGWAKPASITSYMEQLGEQGGTFDLNHLNSLIDLRLIHTGANGIIGDVEFRLYTDPDYGEVLPELAVIYSDGTYDWLSEIFGTGK